MVLMSSSLVLLKAMFFLLRPKATDPAASKRCRIPMERRRIDQGRNETRTGKTSRIEILGVMKRRVVPVEKVGRKSKSNSNRAPSNTEGVLPPDYPYVTFQASYYYFAF